MNWALMRPSHADGQRDPRHRVHDEPLVGLGQALRREHRDRVARVDAGPLDVLHEARDEHVGAVADRVDVDLQALEVGVDAHRPVVVHRGRDGQLAHQVLRPVAELDGQAADDEAGPHDDRVAHPVGDRDAPPRCEVAMPPCGWGMPSRSTRPAKRVRSSARSMVSSVRPGRSTPAATSGAARLSGVWPPNWTSAGQRRVARRRSRRG